MSDTRVYGLFKLNIAFIKMGGDGLCLVGAPFSSDQTNTKAVYTIFFFISISVTLYISWLCVFAISKGATTA